MHFFISFPGPTKAWSTCHEISDFQGNCMVSDPHELQGCRRMPTGSNFGLIEEEEITKKTCAGHTSPNSKPTSSLLFACFFFFNLIASCIFLKWRFKDVSGWRLNRLWFRCIFISWILGKWQAADPQPNQRNYPNQPTNQPAKPTNLNPKQTHRVGELLPLDPLC